MCYKGHPSSIAVLGEYCRLSEKIASFHSRPVAILSMQNKVSTIAANTEELYVHTIADSSTQTE